jgi:hypothetical protein
LPQLRGLNSSLEIQRYQNHAISQFLQAPH